MKRSGTQKVTSITRLILLVFTGLLEFDRDHNIHWGRLYEAKDVKIDWHGRLRSSSE
jgi:hypothetical protein